jgi:parallel beta-helix repeat protein
MGNCGILIEGGSEHRMDGCDIYDLGDAGIVLDGGDRKTLTPGGHCAINNHIHHIGQWSRCYQPAVRLIGVGNRAAHNLIHDGPHCAILLNGNDHLIEFNEIQHVCLETADVGAFYLGRDWTERGNVVRYNFFHDLGGVQQGSVAVYLDDCASGTTVYGNVCYHAQWGVLIGGGRDNIVENNVFYDCVMGIHVDGRGLDPHEVWHNSIYQTMKERLEAMDWQRPLYSERYPALSSLEKYYRAEGGVPPGGDVIRHNISVGGQWLDIGWFATPEMVDVRDNLVGEDPHFVNPGNDVLGFRLKDDSPALKLGFHAIPLESIGLYKDEFRRNLPEAATNAR